MSKNDQNTCLETPDTTPNARLRYLSSCDQERLEEAIQTIQLQHNTLQRSCAVRDNQENCSKRGFFLPKPIKIRI